MIKYLEVKNTFRNKRFILFTVLFPAFWYLLMLNIGKEMSFLGENVQYLFFFTAAVIGIAGNSVVTFSKKICDTKKYYRLQSHVSHYDLKSWLSDQLVVQFVLNAMICFVLLLIGTAYQEIPWTKSFFVLLILIMILGLYLTVIGFFVGLILDGQTISALAMPLSMGASLLIAPWGSFFPGHNWLLDLYGAIQKVFPGYYVYEIVERMQTQQELYLQISLFIITTLLVLVPIIFYSLRSRYFHQK
ncbi:multidrug ABC transporter permease [Fructobacillus papyrifericola]|uniref:Multidrug ABC transporter permease n=1 Tax=Fructobacillus papyrifericola TaxID=2713172 RepID=A0ABS5QR63_9LACO|nr:multidrug ABC transporter permease [Fructobacillus papyrifericola]MBS9335689.1 multidrug ABC transporter permease [Fructobacillus papyrifericola]